MKKLFTKLSLLALFTGLTTFAEVVIYNPTSTNITSLLQRPARIQQVQFSNASGAAIGMTFFDAPTNVLTYVVGAYTNRVISTANVITTWTNYTGVIETSTNLTQISTATPVAATTNNFRTTYYQLIPAGGTVTWTPPVGAPVTFGLAAITTATNAIAVVTYLPSI